MILANAQLFFPRRWLKPSARVFGVFLGQVARSRLLNVSERVSVILVLLLGADEAGKGPVIGSMFVAGLVIEEEKLFDLAGFGVKDSKLLTPAKREILARKINGIATDQYILEVKAQVIDELRLVMTMNEIMVRSFSTVVAKLQADRAILDAADVNAQRFADRVKAMSKTTMDLMAEHKADQRHHIVSAASILAKVRRDASMRELEETMHCKIGSGYPHDQDTINFLTQWVKENRQLPPCARHSWATAQRIKASFI
ncbi:MAG: ribonuclease HII [Methanothrix sp.]|nr:ribonuclease HII [Methanothrix sp.]